MNGYVVNFEPFETIPRPFRNRSKDRSVTVEVGGSYMGWGDDRAAPPSEGKSKRFLRGVVWNNLWNRL